MSLKSCPIPDHYTTYTKLDPENVVDKMVERAIYCADCDRYLSKDYIKIPFTVPAKAIPDRRRSPRI